jgi:hypothetical protein
MPIQDESLSRAETALSALLGRLRRRTGRVGAAVLVLAALAAAGVVFAVCACKGIH